MNYQIRLWEINCISSSNDEMPASLTNLPRVDVRMLLVIMMSQFSACLPFALVMFQVLKFF